VNRHGAREGSGEAGREEPQNLLGNKRSTASTPSVTALYDPQRFRRLPLPGDASTRSYYRLVPRSIAQSGRDAGSRHGIESAKDTDDTELPEEPRALILMVFEPHEGREAVENFMLVTELFQAMECPVPQILRASPEAGALVLEDLGDLTLEQVAATRTAFPRGLYEEALQIVIRAQSQGGGQLGSRPSVAHRCLDRARLGAELAFLRCHLLERNRPLSPVATRATDAAFDWIAGAVARIPPVLNHRDYHSRNLMVTSRGLVLVDYQDALLASPFYDPASLLLDSYTLVPRALREELLTGYLRVARSHAAIPLPSSDAEARWWYYLTALQRSLKALGTFAYQGLVRRRTSFLRSVPLTLHHIRCNPAAERAVMSPLLAMLHDEAGELT